MVTTTETPNTVDGVAGDPLRAALRGIWAAAASSWGEHAEYVDTRGQAVTHAMIEAVRPEVGNEVVELAAGPGGVGLAAAVAVGPTGRVVITDIAPEMTAIAAARASALGLTNVITRERDLENIAEPDESFDVAVCREGLMLVPDPARAAAEALRVLRPGGRASFAVWGTRERNPWLGVLFDAVTATTGMPVPPPGIPGPFSLDAPGALAEILVGAGFTDITTVEIDAPVRFSSFDEWWTVVGSLAGPLSQVLVSLPAETVGTIRCSAATAISTFAAAGGYEIPGVSLVATGRKSPSS